MSGHANEEWRVLLLPVSDLGLHFSSIFLASKCPSLVSSLAGISGSSLGDLASRPLWVLLPLPLRSIFHSAFFLWSRDYYKPEKSPIIGTYS